jgi:hypothetical protein
MDTPAPVPVPPAAIGRALLAKFDADTVQALTAAIAEEIRKAVYEAAVAEARGQLEDEFAARREQLLDRLAKDRQQIERDADARLDAELAAGLRDQQLDWEDRVNDLRMKRRDALARAAEAEALVTALLTELIGGVDQRPVYLYSGGRGLRSLDKAAANRVLARAGVALKSKATVSERRVAVTLDDGRQVAHTVFWLDTAPTPGVTDDDDEGDDPSPPALPER